MDIESAWNYSSVKLNYDATSQHGVEEEKFAMAPSTEPHAMVPGGHKGFRSRICGLSSCNN